VAKRLPISATAELLSGTQIVAWTRHTRESELTAALSLHQRVPGDVEVYWWIRHS